MIEGLIRNKKIRGSGIIIPKPFLSLYAICCGRLIVCIPAYNRSVRFYVKTPFGRAEFFAVPGSVCTGVVKQYRRLNIMYVAVSKIGRLL